MDTLIKWKLNYVEDFTVMYAEAPTGMVYKRTKGVTDWRKVDILWQLELFSEL